MSRRILAAITLATLLVISAVTLVLAQDELLGGKVRTGQTVTVGADETVDGNIYIFAGTATVDGTVQGDLTVFAGTINVNGTIDGDILAAGGTLTIAGEVEGDVRMAGGTLTASSGIGGDALAAGGQVNVGSGGSVAGDLIVSGGQVSVAGDVAGSIEGTAGTYSRTGTVGGSEHVVINALRDDRVDPARDAMDDVVDAIRHFVILLLLGALLLWLMPRWLRSAETALRERPLASVGYGFLTLLGYIVFIIAVVLLVILLALIFGVAQLGALVAIIIVAGVLALLVGTFLFVLAVAYLADIVVGLALGRMFMSGRQMSRWQEVGLMAAGLAIVVIVTSLPVIGGIVKLVVIILGLGALAVAAWSWWRGRRRGAPPPSVQPVAATPPPPAEPMPS
jgi:hypothetical protein